MIDYIYQDVPLTVEESYQMGKRAGADSKSSMLSSEHVRRLLTTISAWYKSDSYYYNNQIFQEAIDAYRSSTAKHYPYFPTVWDMYNNPLLHYDASRKMLMNGVSRPIIGREPQVNMVNSYPNGGCYAYYYDDDGELVDVAVDYKTNGVQVVGNVPFGAHLHIVTRHTDPYLDTKYSNWNKQYEPQTIQSSRGAKGYSDPYPGSRK